jgi:hypothetical protein
MMNFLDEAMRNSHWAIITTYQAHPFIIGDAPVVTMDRTEGNLLYFAIGFARPKVEVFLPSVSPDATFPVNDESKQNTNSSDEAFYIG